MAYTKPQQRKKEENQLKQKPKKHEQSSGGERWKFDLNSIGLCNRIQALISELIAYELEIGTSSAEVYLSCPLSCQAFRC